MNESILVQMLVCHMGFGFIRLKCNKTDGSVALPEPTVSPLLRRPNATRLQMDRMNCLVCVCAFCVYLFLWGMFLVVSAVPLLRAFGLGVV